MRGSLWVLLGASMLYLLVALGIGLLISSCVKNQFVASQLTMLATFMPALMLSGFLFDLRSMPAGVRAITYLSAGELLRFAAADGFSGRRYLVRDPAQCGGAHGHGRAAGLLSRARHPQEDRLRPHVGITSAHPGAHPQGAARRAQGSARRNSLLLPPILQCLLFGYAATYDLNHVPYAVLDRSHSVEAQDLLARLDGTGVFERVANLARRRRFATTSTTGARCSLSRFRTDFARRLQAGGGADVQIIADGRNSNTAGTALGYVGVGRSTASTPIGAPIMVSRGRPSPLRSAPGTTRI